MEIKHDPILASLVQECEEKLRGARRVFSRDTLRRSGLEVGQTMRHPHTGATYRVESARAYTSAPGSLPRVVIEGRRTYKTGRPDAQTTSYLSLSTLDLI